MAWPSDLCWAISECMRLRPNILPSSRASEVTWSLDCLRLSSASFSARARSSVTWAFASSVMFVYGLGIAAFF